MKIISNQDLIFFAKKDKIIAQTIKEILEITDHVQIEKRNDGFHAVIRIIIEQQISSIAARTIWLRYKDRFFHLGPSEIYEKDDESLLSLGLSKPKVKYIKEYLRRIVTKPNFLADIPVDDDKAISYLCEIKGIGQWSAAVYLMLCEGRENIWPNRDVALYNIYNEIYLKLEENRFLHINHFDKYCNEKFLVKKSMVAHILWDYFRIKYERPRAFEKNN